MKKFYSSILTSYKKHKQIVEIEKQAGVRDSFTLMLINKYKIYKQRRKAYILGKRAGSGKNIYLTFGSDRTIVNDAEDSYRRYAMAMKHYNQVLCDREYFLLGFKKFTKLNI